MDYDILDDMATAHTPLLQVLLTIQDLNAWRYINEDDVNEIARRMGITRSRVYSTASFYSEISLRPRGLHLIRICANAPCENAGRTAIQRAVERELHITVGETTGDGLFTLENVNCLGACYMSPAMKVDDCIYGNLTPDKAVLIIARIRKEHLNVQQP